MEQSSAPPPEDPPQPKKRFRPWPKKKEGLRWVIDRDYIRRQYIRTGKYQWKEFCNHWGYNSNPRYEEEFPLRAWREEFIDYQADMHFDSQADRFVQLKKEIIEGRVVWAGEWRQALAGSKALRDIWVNNMLRHHAFNQNNEPAIQAGTVRPLPVPTIAEIAQLALADTRIMMNQAAALLMKSVAQPNVIPLAEKTPEERGDAVEDERVRNVRVALIGDSAISEGKVMEIMSRWYDQMGSTIPDGPETSVTAQSGESNPEDEAEGQDGV